VRRLGLVLLALAALAGALYGSAHLLTGSSGFARAIAWGESDIEDRHPSTPEHDAVVVRLGSDDAGVDWRTVAFDVAGRLNR
jgi:hypothetical protein